MNNSTKPMNILFVLGWPLEHGGHMNSALCVGRHLICSGNNLFVYAPDGPKKSDFIEHGARVFNGDRLAGKFPRNLLAVPSLFLRTLRYRIDVIHAMDYQSLYAAFIVATLLNRRFIYTKAGGTTPDYIIPRATDVVVYSDELLCGMQARYPYLGDRIRLIRARIDTRIFKPAETPPAVAPGTATLFMAMRLEESKRQWLETAIGSITSLAEKRTGFQFLLAGDGGLKPELETRAATINRRFGRSVIRLLGGISDINEMADLYRTADIVIGHGRGIMEAMACGKVVIALGGDNRVTTVSPDSVEAIAYYNFSGRHLQHQPELRQDFTAELQHLLDDPPRLQQLQQFSLDYIRREYAAEIGATGLEALYLKPSPGYLSRLGSLTGWLMEDLKVRIKRLLRNGRKLVAK